MHFYFADTRIGLILPAPALEQTNGGE